MARQPRISTRFSAAGLVHVGAPRLADLLIEAGAGIANLKRQIRLELAAEASPDLLALEINQRITAVSVARTRVSWRKRGELIEDLRTHREMIVERLASEVLLPCPNPTASPLSGGGRRRRPAGRALQVGRHPKGRSEAEERPGAAWRAQGRVQKGASAASRFRERPKQSRRANARPPSKGALRGAPPLLEEVAGDRARAPAQGKAFPSTAFRSLE
ncbi:DUF6880 family protein [Brevundimonas sp. NPDC046655]|uniref:DUF6880 family protein n=1 Tax=unclassified Brevundimonas TaxID=2622653 RepID=UPI00385057A3